MLEIRTLGGLSIKVNNQTIQDLGSRKAEALLVYTAVEGRPQNRNVLAAIFWPESSKEHAFSSLRVALSILRKKLGVYMNISRDWVDLKPEAELYLDLSDLEQKLANNKEESALEIYQGDFLQGFHIRGSSEFEDWLRFEQEYVRKLIGNALHSLITEQIKAGDYQKGNAFVQRLLEFDPLDELAHQKSIRLLALDGQRIAAISQYENCKEILHTELGVEPSKETQELYEQIISGEELASHEPLTPKHNLPASQTSFVGREIELAQIEDLLHNPDCRLLTLLGPGGCGKTRIALQAATQSLRSFPDGTYIIPLEACDSNEYLVPGIAEAIGFNIDNFVTDLDPKTQLIDFLQGRSILLVLDGFENVISAAGLLSDILDHAPNVKMLATSRQILDLNGEWVFHVEGLPTHQNVENAMLDDNGALKLFTERAQQANIRFQYTIEDYIHANRVCKLVEGMPLGIELAAAWTYVLSPLEIEQEMVKSLDFLSTTKSDIPGKHHSLRAMFDSTWMKLSFQQQEMVSKLSVFQGGFDHKAAIEVAGANLSLLSSLMNKSLLRRNEAGHFTMHALLREFAAEKLNHLEEIQENTSKRHCGYYINMLTQRKEDLLSAKMLQARDEIRQEMENLRFAVNWACLHWEAGEVVKMLQALLAFYIVQGWHEGIEAFEYIARRRREYLIDSDFPNPSNDPVVLSAHIHQAFFLSQLGKIEESEKISKECMEGLGELELFGELSECLQNLGINASFRGDSGRARDYIEKAICLGRENDHFIWPTYLLWLGHVYFLLGEYEQAILSLKKSREIFDQNGNLWGTAFALSKMGLVADGLGDHLQAMEYHSEACSIFERICNPAGKGYSLSRMSLSAYFMEDYIQAVELGLAGRHIFQEIGHRWGINISACWLGFAYIGLSDIEKANGYFEDALQQSRKHQMIPLSLYALAGLSCTWAIKGKMGNALEIYRYVHQHPQTPIPSLEQAARWISDVDSGIKGNSIDEQITTIDEVVERIVRYKEH